MHSFIVVIPARFASSRFPGKALADLNGKSVLRRCYEQVQQAVPTELIIVGTDDDRIADECRRFGMRFEMTSSSCMTGTDRVAEVAERIEASWYVNVQGDEPFLDVSGLQAMIHAAMVAKSDTSVINAYSIITEESDFRSATVPKVVTDLQDKLLYISRGAIPTTKQFDFRGARRQIGMYAFRRDSLKSFRSQLVKTPLESLEDVEILRFLELGIIVQMIRVDSIGIAIDTPEDLENARHYLGVD